MMKVKVLAAVLALAVMALPQLAFGQAKIIKIDGSSTVYPITEAVAEEFQQQTKGQVKVTVGISGTGGGFKKFLRGETDISDASRPIAKSEMEEAKKNGIEYVELPIAFDALTVVINKANTWAEKLTVAELKKMWEPAAQGKVMNWKEIRAGFPDAPLKLFGPGADSGTFEYFTEAVCGKAKASRGDFTASEDDNVLVQGVIGDKNALGYFGYAYYAENQGKMKAVAIDNGQGQAVPPSEKGVIDGTYNPLSRPIFIYVSRKALDRPEVGQFVEFYLANAAKLVKEVKYVPLPAEAYEKGLARFKAKATGTGYAGEAKIGMPISDVFKLELKK